MAKRVDENLFALEQEVARARATAVASAGSVVSVEYEAVVFMVGRHFVSASLEPLYFFHLVEHIDVNGTASAISRLYERLSPLLTCNHQWTDLKRASDTHVEAMLTKQPNQTSRPQTCRLCTAYVFADTMLPVVGRSQEEGKNAGA